MSTPIQSSRDDHVSMDYLQSTPRRWVTTYIPLGIFVFVLLFPFYWMVVTSLKPNEELLARDGNPFWILKPTLAHFEKLIFHTAYPDWLMNTIWVSVAATCISLAASVLAAYAIERLRFQGAKPAGVAVHGGSGVSTGVIEQLRQARAQAKFLELVHRLDRETSGVLLLAKRRSALTHLQDQFRGRWVDKTYAALVWGAWPEKLKVIDVPLHKSVGPHGERVVRTTSREDAAGQRSITLVKVVQRLQGYTLLDVTIKTGRTHQIRVHLASQGHAIVGDDRYGDFAANKALARAPLGQPRFTRMFLHARRLALMHPITGGALEFAAPLPEECKVFLQELGSSTAA